MTVGTESTHQSKATQETSIESEDVQKSAHGHSCLETSELANSSTSKAAMNGQIQLGGIPKKTKCARLKGAFMEDSALSRVPTLNPGRNCSM